MVNGDRRWLLFSDPSSMGSSVCGVRRFNFYLGMQIAERAGKENIKDPRQKWKRSEKSADSKLLLIALNIIVCLVMIKAQAREVERRAFYLRHWFTLATNLLRWFRFTGWTEDRSGCLACPSSHLYYRPRNVGTLTLLTSLLTRGNDECPL